MKGTGGDYEKDKADIFDDTYDRHGDRSGLGRISWM